ncbi:MAG: hypothetical protein ABMA64_37025, partial [Myxococcota bacterium]
ESIELELPTAAAWAAVTLAALEPDPAEQDRLLAFAEVRATQQRCVARIRLGTADRLITQGDAQAARVELEAAERIVREPLVAADTRLVRDFAAVAQRVSGSVSVGRVGVGAK